MHPASQITNTMDVMTTPLWRSQDQTTHLRWTWTGVT